MATMRDENFDMWVGILGDVLPDCNRCPEAMLPLRAVASQLVDAAPGSARDTAFRDLRQETQTYYRMAAAMRHEVWKRARGIGDDGNGG
jgi:hypothetical protein